MDKLFRQVSVKERLPEKNGGVIGVCSPEDGLQQFYFKDGQFLDPMDDHPMKVTAWLEEYTLETIQDKRELTATFLINSIRLLDEQGARHLVKELCERFHLLPSDEEILQAVLIKQEKDQTQFMRGIDFILNTLKGGKRNV
ncbi:hypothetical protein [Sphingobacterium thalpophilum]|uniref:hypothetical protein n=1 Tax=Sphingobacterium thalpophilum TaxID=259 RepID=UPI0024A7A27D|nr:hypothetical protein [Sphingobacterium thalpophilum]